VLRKVLLRSSLKRIVRRSSNALGVPVVVDMAVCLEIVMEKKVVYDGAPCC